MDFSLFIILAFIGSAIVILGFIGCFLPALPGPPIAILAVFLLEFTGVYDYNNLWLATITVLTLVIIIADYFIPIYGAKISGASDKGIKGSSLGVLLGIIATFWMGPLSLIAGPFIGAMIGELRAGKTKAEAAKVGLGTLLGFLMGIFGKLIATFVIAATFVYGCIMFIWH